MLRIRSKKGLFNDVKKGAYRVHLCRVSRRLADVRVGDRVQLYVNRDHTCNVYISAVRHYGSLSELLHKEQWKQLAPEMRTERQAHKALWRQHGAGGWHFVVLEYQLVHQPASPPPATT